MASKIVKLGLVQSFVLIQLGKMEMNFYYFQIINKIEYNFFSSKTLRDSQDRPPFSPLLIPSTVASRFCLKFSKKKLSSSNVDLTIVFHFVNLIISRKLKSGFSCGLQRVYCRWVQDVESCFHLWTKSIVAEEKIISMRF